MLIIMSDHKIPPITMSDIKKKVRSENWVEEDKQLLQELIKERVRIIENKNTDTNTNQQKKTCWDGLLDSFNTLCSGKSRTVAQLKTQWGSMKLIEKKKLSLERRELLKTGGGPQAGIASTSNFGIRAWLPEEFVVDENKFDSDSININKIVEKETELLVNNLQDFHNEVVMVDELQPITDNETDEFTPAAEIEPDIKVGFRRGLKFGNSHSIKKRKTKTLRNDTSANEILAISATQIECRRSLHAIQMEVENLRKENEIRKKHVLEFKEKAMQAKYEYYQKKIALLGSKQNQ